MSEGDETPEVRMVLTPYGAADRIDMRLLDDVVRRPDAGSSRISWQPMAVKRQRMPDKTRNG